MLPSIYNLYCMSKKSCPISYELNFISCGDSSNACTRSLWLNVNYKSWKTNPTGLWINPIRNRQNKWIQNRKSANKYPNFYAKSIIWYQNVVLRSIYYIDCKTACVQAWDTESEWRDNKFEQRGILGRGEEQSIMKPLMVRKQLDKLSIKQRRYKKGKIIGLYKHCLAHSTFLLLTNLKITSISTFLRTETPASKTRLNWP